LSEEESKSGAARVAGGAIVKVDPVLAEEVLFQKIPQQVTTTPDVAKILKQLNEVESGPQQVMALVHVLMRQVIATPLGHIIPPEAGARIVKDRIVQSATALLSVLMDRIRELQAEIESSLREGREYEVEEKVRKIISMHLASMVAIREVMNRYLVLYTINLPPNLRPPLAQVKLGMEVIPAGD